jgi:hypothetical protein
MRDPIPPFACTHFHPNTTSSRKRIRNALNKKTRQKAKIRFADEKIKHKKRKASCE